MPFITKEKTDWRYLSLILFLAIAVGAVIFWLQGREPEDAAVVPAVSNSDVQATKRGVTDVDEFGRSVIEDIRYPMSDAGGIYLDMRVEEGRVSLLSDPKITSDYPNYLPGAYELVVREALSDGTVLGEYGADDPRNVKAEQGYSGPGRLDSADFSFIVPRFEEAQMIEIFLSGKQVLSVDISELGRAE